MSNGPDILPPYTGVRVDGSPAHPVTAFSFAPGPARWDVEGSTASPAPSSAVPDPLTTVPTHRLRTGAFWWPVVRWSAGVVAAVTLLVLAIEVVDQGRRLDALHRDLAAARRGSDSADVAADRRLDGLERQFAALDKRSRQVFDPRAVAASVLPSVFLVIADDASGSGFAVGRSHEPGRTNVLTAFHVIERVWAAGRTTVQLERGDNRFTATIADVSKSHDIALLTIGASITGIVPATATPASGEQIMVVGAPLGLTDSVTTGVVSAIRPRPDGPGTVIQFDASVNPGNSGGPVINTRKEVVGVADAKARDAEGIGLAIPMKTVCKTFRVC